MELDSKRWTTSIAKHTQSVLSRCFFSMQFPNVNYFRQQWDQRSFSLLAGIIFTIIALLHLVRIIYGWDPVVEGWTVPKWISWVALVVAGYLGYEGLRFSHQIETKLAANRKETPLNVIKDRGFLVIGFFPELHFS